MARDAVYITLAAAAGLAGAIAISTYASGPAETPASLKEVQGLGAAMELAAGRDRAVVAVVSADWCPPCQQLKRTTLNDERVTAWFDENAVAVVLEDGVNDEDIARLPMQAFPTTFVIRGNEIVGQLMGYAKPGDYLEFLSGSIGSDVAADGGS